MALDSDIRNKKALIGRECFQLMLVWSIGVIVSAWLFAIVMILKYW